MRLSQSFLVSLLAVSASVCSAQNTETGTSVTWEDDWAYDSTNDYFGEWYDIAIPIPIPIFEKYPGENREKAEVLYERMYEWGERELVIISASSTPCGKLIKCNGLGNELVRQLANDTLFVRRNREARWANRINLTISFLTLFVAFLAFRKGKNAIQRSIKNEGEIANLRVK